MKATRDNSENLYAVLVRDIISELEEHEHLVIVGDRELNNVPFAALLDGRSGRYLIEQVSYVSSPSANVFVQTTRRKIDSRVQQVLIVATPKEDQSSFPGLESLTEATGEARTIAAMYERVRLLTAEEATPAAVLWRIEKNQMIHFATHAVMNEREPSRSCLVLAPDRSHGTGALYLHQIARLRLSQTRLVVLAGCRTGAQSPEGYESVRSLAMAFLLAGSRNVVASLWDLDDVAAREFSVRVHLLIQRGATPAEACRNVQITMLRSLNPRLAAPSSWASMQLFGTGS
jgi:CHAT domain-containing protein